MKKHQSAHRAAIKQWEDLIPLLWCEVCEVLKLCLDDIAKNDKAKNKKGLTLSGNSPVILDLYKNRNYTQSTIKKETVDGKDIPLIPPYINPFLPSNSQTDQHLREGLSSVTAWERNKRYPRLAQLTINACLSAYESSTTTAIAIPSPLHIIYNFLIDPNHSTTAAYALTACRNWLSQILKVSPVIGTREARPRSATLLSEAQLRDSIESFNNYQKINARWPDKPAAAKSARSRTALRHTFVGSFLATRGISLLWFSKDQDLEDLLPGRDRVAEAPAMAATLLKNAHFVLSPRYSKESPPPTEEIANQLFGYPLPIKGADVIFNGGLRPSTSGGLVMVVSGEAGAGKTSFSLALANAFKPFGTPTYYISLEETESDIQRKLQALRPSYERKLCITENSGTTRDSPDLFSAVHVSGFNMDYQEFAQQMASVINEIAPVQTRASHVYQKAGTSPGIIVVDNLTVLQDSKEKDGPRPEMVLEQIIADCRKANILTILVTAQDLLTKYRLNYFSDVVIDLKHEGLADVNGRPLRVFTLMKSRHQLARQGAHVFHMSSGKGFRIVPNMDSLIDRRSSLRQRLTDKTKLIHALNFARKQSTFDLQQNKKATFLEIYKGSNILLHGYGSSGKAGLALKLLLTPPVEKQEKLENIQQLNFSSIRHRQKILVVSFLYPAIYYQQLIHGIPGEKPGIAPQLEDKYKDLPDAVLDYYVLYPGFIGPQDFLNKLVMKLDQADLSGEPYTGVMIDGLHNVLLQYPRLQENDIVWAMLYNILGRYPLTVVSTFTNFSVINDNVFATEGSQGAGSRNPDDEIMQKGKTPFLHALVKAADFYLMLTERRTDEGAYEYPLMVRSAIGQPIPTQVALWDRQASRIERYEKIVPEKEQKPSAANPQ
tara:strand:- start:6 stop:2666 length:2661 start_codon:yes stop_codon:yes gene_type:complete